MVPLPVQVAWEKVTRGPEEWAQVVWDPAEWVDLEAWDPVEWEARPEAWELALPKVVKVRVDQPLLQQWDQEEWVASPQPWEIALNETLPPSVSFLVTESTWLVEE